MLAYSKSENPTGEKNRRIEELWKPNTREKYKDRKNEEKKNGNKEELKNYVNPDTRRGINIFHALYVHGWYIHIIFFSI